MTIRRRLTVWFAAVLALSLFVMAVGTFAEISEQRHRADRGLPVESPAEETIEMIIEGGIPAIILGLLGGWLLVRHALLPVANLTEAAEKIHARNLSGRLTRSGNGDELDRLTDVFNAMTARLDDSFQHIREFTLHASHELKTPLTILRAELETALRNDQTSPAQRERLASQIDEIERLAKIVDGLSLLTRADAGQVTLKCESLRLDDLVRESFADTNILAQPQHITVRLGRCDEISFPGDRHRLRQLLLNLADNAVKYNRPDGIIDFSLQPVDGFAVLRIVNTGDGLPPHLQTRVFDRFFRGDASRSHAIEGCGLGLSIVKWIVLAHRGQIQFASQPGGPTTVEVRLPLP